MASSAASGKRADEPAQPKQKTQEIKQLALMRENPQDEGSIPKVVQCAVFGWPCVGSGLKSTSWATMEVTTIPRVEDSVWEHLIAGSKIFGLWNSLIGYFCTWLQKRLPWHTKPSLPIFQSLVHGNSVCTLNGLDIWTDLLITLLCDFLSMSNGSRPLDWVTTLLPLLLFLPEGGHLDQMFINYRTVFG